MASTRVFPLQQLIDWELPWSEYVMYEKEEDVGRRWYNSVELVFRAPDDELTYRIYYPVGKSETSEIEWTEEFDEEVTAYQVEQVTKMVEITAWEDV